MINKGRTINTNEPIFLVSRSCIYPIIFCLVFVFLCPIKRIVVKQMNPNISHKCKWSRLIFSSLRMEKRLYFFLSVSFRHFPDSRVWVLSRLRSVLRTRRPWLTRTGLHPRWPEIPRREWSDCSTVVDVGDLFVVTRDSPGPWGESAVLGRAVVVSTVTVQSTLASEDHRGYLFSSNQRCRACNRMSAYVSTHLV